MSRYWATSMVSLSFWCARASRSSRQARSAHTTAALWRRDWWWARRFGAADQGNALAQYGLGLAYAGGKGVPQDYTEAAKWFRKSADQVHVSANSGIRIRSFLPLAILK